MEEGRRISSSADQHATSAAPHGMTIAALMIAAAQAPLGSTLIAVALPSISLGFDADLVLVTGLLVTAYLTVNVVGQGPAGKLGDQLGHARIFRIGMALYALGALIGVVAPAIWLLVVSRCTMAAAGAMVVPSTLALLRVHMPAERQGRVFGLFGATMAFSAAVGPVLGGVLVGLFGWRSIFLASLPFLAVATVMLRLHPLPGSAASSRGPTKARLAGFDLPGVAFLTVALSLFIVASKADGAARLILIVMAGIGAVGFVLWELRAQAPVLDPRLFRNSAFVAGTGIIALQNFAMYGLLFQLPQFFEKYRDAAPIAVGVMLFTMMIGMVGASPIGGRMSDRFGPRLTALAGATPLLLGLLLLSRLVAFSTPFDAAPGLLLCGIGLGLCTAPAQASSMSSVPRERAGMAAGTSSTMRYLGGIASILVLGLVLGNNDLVSAARHEAMVWIFVCAAGASAVLAAWLPTRVRAAG